MPDTKVPYPQGKPCWLDYFAEDQNAAIAFYHELFGWSGEPNPEFGGYAVLSTGERAAAAIAPRMPDMPPAPPAWNIYFTVDDIDAVAEQIGKLGGTKLVGPDEVPGVGKLVFGTDPAGAPFGLWQPGPFPGFGVEGEHGAPCWFELETHQGGSSAEYYAALLGVEAPEMAEMPGSYWTLSVAGEMAGGIWQDPEGKDAPVGGPHWVPYIQVDDVDTTVSAAVAAGAAVVFEAKDTPYGRFAKLRDPQGAEFSVIKPPATAGD
jgi:predicted enzyme related to lactoylglutathione lyase